MKLNPIAQRLINPIEFCFTVCRSGEKFTVTKFQANGDNGGCTPDRRCPGGSSYGEAHIHVGPLGTYGLSGRDDFSIIEYIVNGNGIILKWVPEPGESVNGVPRGSYSFVCPVTNLACAKP